MFIFTLSLLQVFSFQHLIYVNSYFVKNFCRSYAIPVSSDSSEEIKNIPRSLHGAKNSSPMVWMAYWKTSSFLSHYFLHFPRLLSEWKAWSLPNKYAAMQERNIKIVKSIYCKTSNSVVLPTAFFILWKALMTNHIWKFNGKW